MDKCYELLCIDVFRPSCLQMENQTMAAAIILLLSAAQNWTVSCHRHLDTSQTTKISRAFLINYGGPQIIENYTSEDMANFFRFNENQIIEICQKMQLPEVRNGLRPGAGLDTQGGCTPVSQPQQGAGHRWATHCMSHLTSDADESELNLSLILMH